MSPAIRARGQGPTPSLHARLKESLHNDTLRLPDKAGRFQDRPVQKNNNHTHSTQHSESKSFFLFEVCREKKGNRRRGPTTWPLLGPTRRNYL